MTSGALSGARIAIESERGDAGKDMQIIRYTGEWPRRKRAGNERTLEGLRVKTTCGGLPKFGVQIYSYAVA